MKHIYKLLPRSWQGLIGAVLVVTALGASFFLLLQRIVSTAWLELFVNNADSLVLPLVQQSITLGEPFAWIFSSQLFLFPEAALYALASLVTDRFTETLLLNAFLNYVLLAALLYICFRLIDLPKRLASLISLGTSLFVVAMAWLEFAPVNNRFVAMPFFTTTYYCGALLCSLAALAIVLYLIRAPQKHSSRANVVGWFILSGLCFLATASNPMFVLQFVLPLSAVLCLAVLLRVASYRQGLLGLLPVYVGVGLGFIARLTVFRSYIAADVNGYIHPDKIGSAALRVKTLVAEAWSDSLQRFEVMALSLVVLLAAAAFIWIVVKAFRTRAKQTVAPGTFLMTGLGGVTPLFLIVGLILSGNAEFRYLLPLVVFPFLSLGSLSGKPFLYNPKFLKAVYWTTAAICLVVIGIAFRYAHISDGVTQFTTHYPSEVSCLDASLRDTPYQHGVAQFWRARNVQLHSKTGLVVSQVTPEITAYNWLSNRAVYAAYDYNFVVADSPRGVGQYLSPISESSVTTTLGSPSDVFDCGTITIYGYSAGTEGHSKLNARLP